jgi:predicted secreted hydrolase
MPEQANPLAGRTFKWTFNDGPTAGKTYEHVFNADGTAVFKEVNGAQPAAATGEKGLGIKYASFQIAPNMHLISYLSNHGYTLTVAMNLDNKELHGFASNDKEWHPLKGTVEVVQ